jgi:hypothetical protein
MNKRKNDAINVRPFRLRFDQSAIVRFYLGDDRFRDVALTVFNAMESRARYVK